jgi:prepilin signal peptidase PulO-like enzyme (type II secretory pathway)
VEITTSVIFLLIFNFQFLIFNEFLNVSIFQFLNLLFLFYIASVLVVIFVFDLKHYLIPDKVLFPAIIIAFVYRVLGNWKLPAWPVGREIGNLTFVLNYFYAILAGAGFFFLLWLISKGKWMGFGDVKLAVLLGLILGFPNILAALFSAFFIGSVVSIFLMAKKIKGMKSEVPFAPFLIAGTFIAMFWGDKIINWYLGLILF